VWEENHRVYGIPKVWRPLQREGIAAARCTLVRWMRALGLRGAVWGLRVRTTPPAATFACPSDRVHRVYQASRPNALWLADLTCVASRAGCVHVAFVIDADARRIVGGRVSSSLRTGLVLGALEPALYARAVDPHETLIHSSDRGSQCLSIRDTERVAEADIKPSLGRMGDSYDNALAESIIGRYKTEVIRPRGPWRGLEAVECATLEWVDWFNHRRLLKPIGGRPPAEAEVAYYRHTEPTALAA